MSGARVKLGGDSSDQLWLAAMTLLVGIGAWIWATGQLAGILFGPAWISVGIADLPGIAIALPGTIDNPAQAWPEAVQHHLPGPVGFTVAAVLAGAVVTALVIVIALALTRFTGLNGQTGMASGADIDRKLSAASALKKAKRLRPSLEGRPSVDHVAISLGKAVGSGKRVYADLENAVWVSSAPREGKTSRAIIPWVAHWQGPVLTTSVRPDVAEATYAIREALGPVAVLDFSDTHWPSRFKWNPVIGCEDYDLARRRAEVIIGTSSAGDSDNAAFFRGNGINLLAGLLHAAAYGGRTLADVANWVLNDTNLEPMRLLKHATGAAHGVEDNLHSLYGLAPETRGSLFETAMATLAPILSARAQRIFCPTTSEHLDIETFIRDSGTIYIIAPLSNSSQVAPFISMFVDEYNETCLRLANASVNSRHDPPVGEFLDEPFSVAPLKNLPEYMSYAAGSGIFVVVIFQEFAQARERWGEHNAEIMWGNATVKIALGGLAAADAQRFADEAGKIWHENPNPQYGPGGTSHSPRSELRDVILPSQVRQLDSAKGETLVIAGSTPPVKTRLTAYYKAKDRSRYADSIARIRADRERGAAVASEPAAASAPWSGR